MGNLRESYDIANETKSKSSGTIFEGQRLSQKNEYRPIRGYVKSIWNKRFSLGSQAPWPSSTTCAFRRIVKGVETDHPIREGADIEMDHIMMNQECVWRACIILKLAILLISEM